MQIDDLDDELTEAVVTGPVNNAEDSEFGLPATAPANTADDSEFGSAAPVAQTQQAEPVAAVNAVQEEAAKACCICGVDVSQKQRGRDHSGRHWCTHCIDFSPAGGKSGMIPCPDCGRDTRPLLMVELKGEKVCPHCHQGYLAEIKHRRLHKDVVTAHPETEIRRTVRMMVKAIIGMAALSAFAALYHFHLLYFAPKPWVPFQSAFYFSGIMTAVLSLFISAQYIRMAFRKRARRAEYDRMVREATNHVLALDDDSHAMGVSEAPEPIRRRVERAIARVEACGGLGIPQAGKIIESLSRHGETVTLVDFLQAQRPNTNDTVARNREIATISYLQVDLATATSAVTAILLRVQNDQDAMTRLALISYRNGELVQAKNIFKRVIHVAREKNSQADLAAAFCNLGMLHFMLNEFDDAEVRYGQAMNLYSKLDREDGRADCLLNLGLIAFKQKKWVEVEDQLRKAMAINKRRKRLEGLAICCSLLGMILQEKEVPELQESKKLLNQAVKLNLELGRAGGVAAAYGNLGLVYVKQEDFPAATELLLKALAIYQRIKRPKMAAKIQGMMKTVNTLNAQKVARGR